VISFPAESDIAIDVGLRHADVLAFHGVTVAEAAEKVAQVKGVAGDARPAFWINLNMILGETDDAARRHVREIEDAIRRLLEFRAGGDPGLRSIREDRFAERDVTAGQWADDVLYLGLTALSRATPALVGSPSTIADAVLGYHALGIGIVTLGTHVTNPRDAELRRETLRLIKQAVSLRDAAAPVKAA
jgi:alkanesulfonate monooxygenase